MKTRVFILPIVLTAVVSCATQRKVEKLKNSPSAPILALSREQSTPEIGIPERVSDSLVVISPDGRETIIMKAIRDDDGDMVANDVLDAAMVTARFRNVAERHGKIDLEFQIRVPQSLQDSKWQLRFYPKMFLLSDSVSLDPVLVTGKGYRKAQLRGYEQYRKFLSTIITDTTRFIDLHQLEVFLERNIPELFALKGDTTFVYHIETNPEIAGNLKGHLMLVHGDIDNNVHPANTIRVVNALIRANKRFDMLILPGQRHGFGDMNEYFFWRMADYYAEWLIGDSERYKPDITQMNND